MTTEHRLFGKELLCFDTVPLLSYALTCALSRLPAVNPGREHSATGLYIYIYINLVMDSI